MQRYDISLFKVFCITGTVTKETPTTPYMTSTASTVYITPSSALPQTLPTTTECEHVHAMNDPAYIPDEDINTNDVQSTGSLR